MAGWVEDSREQSRPFGPPTIDGRPRFDMGAEHSAAHPALRRVNNPSDVSDAYRGVRSEEHTSELQSLMRISYAVFSLKKKNTERTNAKQTHNKKKNNLC